MNLRWNPDLYRWEAEFSSDFQADLAAVKAAGFKTDGPPAWVWYSKKAEPLAKLKGTPGLTITKEARERFEALHRLEEKNKAVKAEAAAYKKTLEKEGALVECVIPEKGYIDASDLPPIPPLEKFIPPPPPSEKCFICESPVYSYEYEGRPTCMWCQKIVLDENEKVC